MERRKIMLLSIMVAMIIAFAVFSSFGSVWFSNSNTVPVLWPSHTQNVPSNNTSPDQINLVYGYQRVQITPENVQSVLQTMKRPEQYSQTILLHLYWGAGESSSVSIQGCKDGAYSAAKVIQGAQIQYNIWGNGVLYRWYQGNKTWYQGKATFMDHDLLQRIPTYETILSLPKGQIRSASYTMLDQKTCIYVEAVDGQAGNNIRYWIDATQGLLLRAEAYNGEQIIWRVEISDLTPSITNPALFFLPNGTDVRTLS